MQDNKDNNQNSNRQGVRRPVQGQRRPANGQGRPVSNGQQRAQGQGAARQTAQGVRRPVSGQGRSESNSRRSAQRPTSSTQKSAQTAQRPKQGSKARPNNKTKRAKKGKWKIALFVVEILVICILVGACWAMAKANKIQHVQITDDEKKEELAIDEGIAESEVLKGYRNIALFGVDSREGQLGSSTRTDTIMIASINLDTKEVQLVSVYRDTWLNMSTDSYNKANAAYAQGGYKQAMAMLNMNMDLDIEDFVTIGFDGLIDVIDAVGGVEIDVKQAEIDHINSYQISMAGEPDGTLNAKGEPNYTATAGVDYTPVTRSGVQTLNGLQATAYARVRYVGSDIERASRQRTVLTKVAKKAMTLNPATLNKIADAVFPKVMTSLSLSEILDLLKDIASYEIGEQTGFPFEDYIQPAGRVGKASVVVPVDLEKNVSLLHEFLFDEAGYEPSGTVKKCSQKIASDTGVSYNGE